MSRSWKGGSTRAWRRTRAAILANNLVVNGGRCQIATPGTWRTRDGRIQQCAGQADCVHHTQGKRHGDNPRYLVAACTPCNLHVGNPESQADPKPRPMTKW